MKNKYAKPVITTKNIRLNIFFGNSNGTRQGSKIPSIFAQFAYCDTSYCGSGTSQCWSPGETPPGYPR